MTGEETPRFFKVMISSAVRRYGVAVLFTNAVTTCSSAPDCDSLTTSLALAGNALNWAEGTLAEPDASAVVSWPQSRNIGSQATTASGQIITLFNFISLKS